MTGEGSCKVWEFLHVGHQSFSRLYDLTFFEGCTLDLVRHKGGLRGGSKGIGAGARMSAVSPPRENVSTVTVVRYLTPGRPGFGLH